MKFIPENIYLVTIRDFLNRPADVLDLSLRSTGSRYQHPFIFNMVGIVITVLLFSLFLNFSELFNASTHTTNDEITRQLQERILTAKARASSQFLPLSMVFLLIPALSIAGLFFFRDELEGFYSNLILNSFAVGTAIPFTVFLMPFWIFSEFSLVDPLIASAIPGLIIGLVILRSYAQYLSVTGIMGTIRILSSYILGYMIFLLLRDFVAGVIGYFIFAVNRLLDIWFM